MDIQAGLFDEQEVKPPEPRTTVRLGTRSAQVPLIKKRREATQKLREVLSQLEGKDILVGQYCDYWWYDDLRLNRLQVERLWPTELPSVVVLWGMKGQQVRIFLDRLYQMREQYYDSGKPYYLLDFWNGFGGYPIEQFKRTGYQCLHIEAAR